MMSPTPKKRALISVYDKSGVVELAHKLIASGYEIIASGGTAEILSKAEIAVMSVESVTGSDEILGGRVKTLHPLIHGAILADLSKAEHRADISAKNITPIDLVIINLYPFEEVLASKADHDEIIENIDIGGSALLRASAKNYKQITIISSTNQYPDLIGSLGDGFSLEQRKSLAASAFALSQRYESAISNWLNPDQISLSFSNPQPLRYGENPHQSGALYRSERTGGIANAALLHGKEMSYNNYLDADAAYRAVSEHSQSAVAIIKHAIPCGIAIGDDSASAYQKALACDPVSAFGGVVASNSAITTACAEAISKVFTEVIIAPSYEAGALEILQAKAQIRILQVTPPTPIKDEMRAISGGVLLQERDRLDQSGDDPRNWRLVAGSAATDEQLADLEFSWRAIRSIRSNAILIAKDGAAIGIGAGQVNRLDSAQLAVKTAGQKALGAVAASDAFFPFADGLEVLIDAGVVAIVQPGGSKRDEEVIAAAQAAKITMYFTGIRHFSHQ
jgi:phosphoribosylaminoimidazolecarboxamide formyltransferase/IMP cyclohydrolase